MKRPAIALLLFVASLFVSTTRTGYEPSGTHTWYNADVDSTRRHTGGPKYNYLDNGVWRATDLSWFAQGGDLVNLTNNQRSRIDGITNVAEYEFEGEFLRFRPVALVAYRRTTHARVVLDNSPDFANRTFLDSVVTYSEIFPGVDLEVICRLEGVSFHWVFHQANRDLFASWWSLEGSPGDAYWGVVTRFDISGLGPGVTIEDSLGVMDLSVDVDVVNRLEFVKSGVAVNHSPVEYLEQFLPAVGEADGTQFPVIKRVVQIAGESHLLEAVKWSDAVQLPGGDISHSVQVGSSTIYGTNAHTGSRQRLLLIQPDNDATIDSIVTYRYGTQGVFHTAVYNEAGTTLLDSAAEVSSSAGWHQQVAILGASLTGSNNYLVVQWGDHSASGTRTGAETGFERFTNTGVSYGAWVEPISKNNSTTDEAQSQYIVVTESGGGGSDPLTRRRRI